MNFEKDFPSLKGMESHTDALLFSERNNLTFLFNERAITNHCLDKQKVKEVINKYYNKIYTSADIVIESILMELGFEVKDREKGERR